MPKVIVFCEECNGTDFTTDGALTFTCAQCGTSINVEDIHWSNIGLEEDNNNE